MNKPVLFFTGVEPFQERVRQKGCITVIPVIECRCGSEGIPVNSRIPRFGQENVIYVQVFGVAPVFQPADPCFLSVIFYIYSSNHSGKHVLVGFQIWIVRMKPPGIHRGVCVTEKSRFEGSLSTLQSKVGEMSIEWGAVIHTTMVHQVHPCK